MKKNILIFLILFACAGTSMAGTPLELSITENSVYAFRFGYDNTRSLNNFFIKEIARYNYLNLYKTEYRLDFELEVKIAETPEGQFNMETEVKRQDMTGDIYYEDFDLSDVLLPSIYHFNLQAGNGTDTLTISFDDLQTGNINLMTIGRDQLGKFTEKQIKVTGVDFSYADDDRIRFEQRIIDINRYLGFYELLGINLKKAENIDPDEQKDVLSAFFEIYDIERFYDSITANQSKLNIPVAYQDIYNQNLKALHSQLRRLTTIYRQNIDTLHISTDPGQMITAAGTCLDLQSGYLKQMNNANHLLEPVYLLVTNFFGTTGDWEIVKNRLHEYFSGIRNKIDVDRLFSGLNQQFYDAYILEAENQLTQQNYNEAVLFLTNAGTFCERYPEIECELQIFHKISMAKYGIYDAYLSVANSAVKAGNPELGYKYLLLAKKFQEENSHLIISSGKVDLALESLAWTFLKSGNDLLKSGDIEFARTSFVNATEIYNMLDLHTYDDLIQKQISKTLFGN